MTKRVLFIDDQLKDWEYLLRQGLKEYDFELKGEEDPSNAIKVIASYQPDIVLLDIEFPNLPADHQGKPTLEKIKEEYPNLPVMMITSTMEETKYRTEDYKLAGYRYSKKGIMGADFSGLADLLRQLIAEAQARAEGGQDKTGYSRYGFIVGVTTAMKDLTATLDKIADQDHTVLITGESGTGKELVAQAIHRLSRRADKPFVSVVCSAMPKELLESELFGHEKGAFTGAVAQKKGKFEIAADGTIFLDEIGELSAETQVKLLRFLQEKQFERVGGNQVFTSNARIVAATNRDLTASIKEGRFREDLFFRLDVVSLHLPPLRERTEDIPLLFGLFVKKANEKSSKRILPVLREDLRERLASHSWPGNIRELENRINRAVALADENILQLSNFADLAHQNHKSGQIHSALSGMVEQVLHQEVGWEELKDELGARGSMRREFLLALFDRWHQENGRRPNSLELAECLKVTPGNMRRILSECGIKLTQIP